jgi:hypothetical protein
VPIALVASVKSGTNSGGTTSAGIDTTGASLLVLAVSYFTGSPAPTISDSKGNTWTPLTAVAATAGAANQRTRLYYAAAPTVGAAHTFTASGGGTFPGIAVLAFSGALLASPFDQENGAAGVTPGAVTPTTAGQVVVTAVGSGDPDTGTAIDGSFAVAQAQAGSGGNYFAVAIGYLVQTTAAVANPTWTVAPGDTNTAAVIATFKAATGNRRRRLLLAGAR